MPTPGRRFPASSPPLRSLFHYLSQIAEDDDFYPLLKRNVMAKVAIKRTHKAKDTAAKLEGKLLQEEEISEFLHYVKQGYGIDVADNKQALFAYERNSIRDACIVSLILHSGLRVSEVVNLNVDDLDLKKKLTYVYRKGSNDDSFKTPVYFRQEATGDMQSYLGLREKLIPCAQAGKSAVPSRCQRQAGGLAHDKKGHPADGPQVCQAIRQAVFIRSQAQTFLRYGLLLTQRSV